MHLFKTSGKTYGSVVENQKHAFSGKPKNLFPGDIILVSKNKKDLAQGEKQISYLMKFKEIRPASDQEIEKLWPGNAGRWKYIIDCEETKSILSPFDLEEVIGTDARMYKSTMTFIKVEKDDENKILKHIGLL